MTREEASRITALEINVAKMGVTLENQAKQQADTNEKVTALYEAFLRDDGTRRAGKATLAVLSIFGTLTAGVIAWLKYIKGA